jgi:hypothetical protein
MVLVEADAQLRHGVMVPAEAILTSCMVLVESVIRLLKAIMLLVEAVLTSCMVSWLWWRLMSSWLRILTNVARRLAILVALEQHRMHHVTNHLRLRPCRLLRQFSLRI